MRLKWGSPKFKRSLPPCCLHIPQIEPQWLFPISELGKIAQRKEFWLQRWIAPSNKRIYGDLDLIIWNNSKNWEIFDTVYGAKRGLRCEIKHIFVDKNVLQLNGHELLIYLRTLYASWDEIDRLGWILPASSTTEAKHIFWQSSFPRICLEVYKFW